MYGEGLESGWRMDGEWMENGWRKDGERMENGWRMDGEWMENHWRMTGIKTFTPPDNDWLTDKLQTFADNSSCRLIRMSGQ